jgi:hypothetical protein
MRCMENKSTATGELLALEDCTETGRTELCFGHPVEQGYPVEVSFRLSPDGSLYVLGRDPRTGNAVDATFKTDSILTREELAAARSRALAAKVTA